MADVLMITEEHLLAVTGFCFQLLLMISIFEDIKEY